MLITGTGADVRGFSAIRSKLMTVLICFSAQLVLLPLIAVSIASVLGLSPLVAVGLVILSISPGGTLSNFYTYFGRENVELSVALTAIGVFVYAVAFPFLIAVVSSVFEPISGNLNLPVMKMTQQILFFVAVPMAIGMWIRNRFVNAVELARHRLDILANLLVLALVGVSTWVGWPILKLSLPEIALASALFTTAALGVGALVTRGIDPRDRPAVTIECAVRNVPVAVIVMSNAFDDLTIVGFFVGYFLFHAPILMGYSTMCRKTVCKHSKYPPHS
nr:hypothetical protein [Roseovarius sp. EL26]